MTIDPGFILALVLALVAGVVWLVRLEAKVNRANERHDELSKTFWRLSNRIDAGKVYVFKRSQEREGEDA